MSYNKITANILTSLINIVGKDAVITEHDALEKYSHDETEDLSYYPEVAVKPQTAQQISELLKLCNKNLAVQVRV